MDVLLHRLGEAVRQIQAHRLTGGETLGGLRPQGHRARHAEGHPGPLHRLFVGGEADVHRGAQRGDVHGVPHGIFNIVSKCVSITVFFDQNGRLDLAGADIHLARLDVELPDGLAADAVGPRQLHDGIIGVESGSGVGGAGVRAGAAAGGKAESSGSNQEPG